MQAASAQSLQRGSLVLDFNVGGDVYKVAQHNIDKASGYSQDTTTGAASINWNVGIEYGLLNWLGIGLQAKFDSYVHDTGSVSSALGFEIGAIANAHIIRAKHFDLLAGIDIGYSSLTINYKDNGLVSNFQVYGSGSWFDFHITPRLYFGRFGINLNFYLPVINYPNLSTNLQQVNESVAASWKGNGFGTTFGLQYRILN